MWNPLRTILARDSHGTSLTHFDAAYNSGELSVGKTGHQSRVSSSYWWRWRRCAKKRLSTREMYIAKSSGPRTLSCGTPNKHAMGEKQDVPTPTYWNLTIEIESSHSRATSSIPNLIFRRSAETPKLMMSNVMEMSSASRTVTRWLSMLLGAVRFRLISPLNRLTEIRWNSTGCRGWWRPYSWIRQSCRDQASQPV